MEKDSKLVSISANNEIIEAIEKEEGSDIELIDEEEIEEGGEIEEEKLRKKFKPRKIKYLKNKKFISILIIFLIIIFGFVSANFLQNSNNNEKNFSVKIKEKKIGDSASYKVTSTFFISNNKGILTKKIGEIDVKIKDIDLDLKGTAYTKFEGTIDTKNGFQRTHKTLKSRVWQELDLNGKAYTNNPMVKEVELDGNIDTYETLFSDLNTNTTIQSQTKFYLNISADTGDEIKSEDIFYSWPDLNKNLDFSEIFLNRTFKLGDFGEENVDEALVSWKAVDIEKVGNHKTLKIHITLDKGTMDKNRIKNFFANLWIANGFSLPLKIEISAKWIDEKGNDFSLSYLAEISDFEEGNEDIPYGTCSYGYSKNQHFISQHKDAEINKIGEYVPVQGSKPFLPKFNASKAIETAKRSSEFSNYLKKNPDAYVVYGFYNETYTAIWNLTFGEKGEDFGYYVNVTEKGVKNEGEISFSKLDLEVENSKSELGNLLTFSSSENIFLQNDIIRNEMGNDYNGLSFGIHSFMTSPKFDINSMFFKTTKLNYAYFLEKDDGTFSSAMDAKNGSIIYLWKHEGDKLLL